MLKIGWAWHWSNHSVSRALPSRTPMPMSSNITVISVAMGLVLDQQLSQHHQLLPHTTLFYTSAPFVTQIHLSNVHRPPPIYTWSMKLLCRSCLHFAIRPIIHCGIYTIGKNKTFSSKLFRFYKKKVQLNKCYCELDFDWYCKFFSLTFYRNSSVVFSWSWENSSMCHNSIKVQLSLRIYENVKPKANFIGGTWAVLPFQLFFS